LMTRIFGQANECIEANPPRTAEGGENIDNIITSLFVRYAINIQTPFTFAISGIVSNASIQQQILRDRGYVKYLLT
ncbi:MAG TPA: hypothetical protein VM783_02275, partial [Candidatus Acidoferrum sp.]|nr:hypothetical protein [Candidatus Acidoferrum sp.]